MNPILTYVISYLIVFFLAIGIISFLLRGLFWRYMRVRGSRGRLILVRIMHSVHPYYRIGKLEEQWLVYKDVGKVQKRLTLTKSNVYNHLGCNWVDVDPVKNAIVDYSEAFKAVSGFDADAMNSLYLRALFRPSLLDPITKIILIVVIVGAIIALVNVGLGFMMMKKVDHIIQSTNFIAGMLQNQTLVR